MGLPEQHCGLKEGCGVWYEEGVGTNVIGELPMEDNFALKI